MLRRRISKRANKDAPPDMLPACAANRGFLIDMFCAWSAKRSRTHPYVIRKLLRRANNLFDGGISGIDFRRFYFKILELSLPLCPNSTNRGLELLYKTQWWWHILRFVHDDRIRDMSQSPVIEAAVISCSSRGSDVVEIADFGCGVAAKSMSACLTLRHLGRRSHLTLIDIGTPMLDFASWTARRLGIDATSVETRVGIDPPVPRCDMVVALNVIEHLPNPERALKVIGDAVHPGGAVLANLVNFSKRNIEHISPKLNALRSVLESCGFKKRDGDMILYVKSQAASGG